MLRVLTLSTLFPNGAQPTLGVFVERQTLGLAAEDAVAVQVVAPIGLPIPPLDRHRHYARRRALPAREEWKGLTVHRPRYRVWPVIGHALTPGAIVRALCPVLADIRRSFPFDVIDAQFFWPDGPAAIALGRAFGVPVSIKARGSDIHVWGAKGTPRRQVIAAGRAADGLLAVSGALRRDMVAMGMAADRIAVHLTGVDLDRFKPADRVAAKAALGVTGPLAVAAGALVARKGQALAIAALPALPDLTLILVGAGPERDALEQEARRLGVADRVRFAGAQPHEALPGFLAAADLMVLPTVSEGLANVWVESLACGTPVVTSDVGGAREAIDRPAAGRLVPRDPAAIAEAMRALLASPPDPADLHAAARRFSWERNAAELHAHLARLAGGGPTS